MHAQYCVVLSSVDSSMFVSWCISAELINGITDVLGRGGGGSEVSLLAMSVWVIDVPGSGGGGGEVWGEFVDHVSLGNWCAW